MTIPKRTKLLNKKACKYGMCLEPDILEVKAAWLHHWAQTDWWLMERKACCWRIWLNCSNNIGCLTCQQGRAKMEEKTPSRSPRGEKMRDDGRWLKEEGWWMMADVSALRILLCHSFWGNFSFPSVCSFSKSKPISLIILRTTFIFILLASALS